MIVDSSWALLNAEPTSSKDCGIIVRQVSKSRKLGRSFIKMAGVASVLATTFFGGPTLFHNLQARARGEVHIGLGIYLDMQNIEALLTPAEREYLKLPNKDPATVATIFSNYLNGGYKEQSLEVFPPWREASEFMCVNSLDRGMCKHKAVVMKGILDHYGIGSRIEQGHRENQSWFDVGHTWVLLTDSELADDPTSNSMRNVGFIMPREDYLNSTSLKPDPAWMTFWSYELMGGAFR